MTKNNKQSMKTYKVNYKHVQQPLSMMFGTSTVTECVTIIEAPDPYSAFLKAEDRFGFYNIIDISNIV